MTYDVPSERKVKEIETFNELMLSGVLPERIKEVFIKLLKYEIDECFISGGFATAIGHFCGKTPPANFASFYGDIDVYISNEKFQILSKFSDLEAPSNGIRETTIQVGKNNTPKKVQFINMNNRTIFSIISDFDLDFNMNYLELNMCRNPSFYYLRGLNPSRYFENNRNPFNSKLGSPGIEAIQRFIKYALRFGMSGSISIPISSLQTILDKIKIEVTENTENETETNETSKTPKNIQNLKRFNNLDID